MKKVFIISLPIIVVLIFLILPDYKSNFIVEEKNFALPDQNMTIKLPNGNTYRIIETSDKNGTLVFYWMLL